MEDLTIRDFLAVAGSTRALANALGLKDQQGFWRVSQWCSRGVIPRYARFEYAVKWRKLARKIKEIS
jgi:hypothetical protein